MSSNNASRSKKYKKRKMNEKRGLAFLPRLHYLSYFFQGSLELFCKYFDGNHHISSSSDSDEEELPHSQRGQKQTQVFIQSGQIVEPICKKRTHLSFFPSHFPALNFSQCQIKGQYHNMSHSQMLGKVESGGGPIFKVVLEC